MWVLGGDTCVAVIWCGVGWAVLGGWYCVREWYGVREWHGLCFVVGWCGVGCVYSDVWVMGYEALGGGYGV